MSEEITLIMNIIAIVISCIAIGIIIGKKYETIKNYRNNLPLRSMDYLANAAR